MDRSPAWAQPAPLPWASFGASFGAHADEQAQAERKTRAVAFVVLVMPLNWILGTTLFAIAAVALLLARPPLRPSFLEYAFGLLAAALMLAILAGLASHLRVADVVGSLFNVVVIAVLILFLNAGRLFDHGRGGTAERVYAAARTCFWVQVCIVAFARLYVALTGEAQVKFPTFIGLAGELPGILLFYSHVYLSVGDGEWPFTDPRATGIGIYVTEGAILLLVVGLLASLHAMRQGRFVRALVVEAAIVAGLVEMASRTTTVAYVASLLFLVPLLGRRMSLLSLAGGCAAATLLFVGSVYHPGLFAAASESANLNRAASSLTRMKSYALGIQATLENSPLIGLGRLPKDETVLEIPIGSHSSWVSLFTRGGFTALFCWACINGALLANLARSLTASLRDGLAPIYRVEVAMLSRCVFVLMLWWLTEDFDFPAHEAVLSGLCIGLLCGALKEAGRPQGLEARSTA